MRLSARVHGRSYRFRSVCDVLARAGEPKAGDLRAGLGAASHLERAAARCVLAELTLADLRAHPPRAVADDEVSRALEAGVNDAAYAEVRALRVGELRDWLLADTTSAEQIRRAGRGLTAEMAAAVTKLCSNLDLMYGARRMPVTTRARTTLGLRGRLATRLRTGHPRDDHRGITAVIYEGLAYGCGDALIAVDPGADDPAGVRGVLDLTHDLIARLQIPTQNCVLARAVTQLRALEQGAPLDIFFHRLAGTEHGLRELGASVALLDDARALAHERGALRGTQVMYFTAGQGLEDPAGAASGVDQTTRAARSLALARRYNPLLVETVTGPSDVETAGGGRRMVRAALEDHFMGKLLGLPLGVDAAYGCDAGADHNDGDLLACALATAGAQHLAVAPAGDDVASGAQCASFHDAAALRQMLGLRPAPEFEEWLAERGLMADGRLTGRAGDPGVFMRG